MNILKRIFNYFFLPDPDDPPLPLVRSVPKRHEYHEVAFFEPVTPKQIFDKSKGMKEFLTKISK